MLALFILYGSSGPWAGEVSRAEELPGISLPDIAQNLLLYIPFGVFGVWALRGLRRSRTALFLSLVAIALVYSAVMELLQMLLADRIASPSMSSPMLRELSSGHFLPRLSKTLGSWRPARFDAPACSIRPPATY